jgi:hypothetical protein
MLLTPGPPTRKRRRRSRRRMIVDFKRGRGAAWQYVTAAVVLAVAATGVSFGISAMQTHTTTPTAAHSGLGFGEFSTSALSGMTMGKGELNGSGMPAQAPVPMITAMASGMATPDGAQHPGKIAATGSGSGGAVPLGGASHAGSLMLNDTGAQLTAWNETSSFCSEQSWGVPNGTVSTTGSQALLGTNGQSGSCVALISPQAVSSGVIEARLDFPALPGSSNTIADWTSFWLTDGANWPNNGELDAVEAEPVDGINAVSWHSGTQSNEFSASTDDFFPTKLPKDAPDLTPGWHTVDIVYAKGYFAVYYDGKQFTSYTSSNVTGDPLNMFITTSVTANNSTVQGQIGGSPVNSDSSPATYGVQYLKVWSFK